jgi:hypothetical protein
MHRLQRCCKPDHLSHRPGELRKTMINIKIVSALTAPCSWRCTDLIRCTFHCHWPGEVRDPIPPNEFGMEAHVSPGRSGSGGGLSSGDYTSFYRCHDIKDHMLTMDTKNCLSGMTKVSLFFLFRERAMFLNIEFKSLVGKDIPCLADELLITLTIFTIVTSI